MKKKLLFLLLLATSFVGITDIWSMQKQEEEEINKLLSQVKLVDIGEKVFLYSELEFIKTEMIRIDKLDKEALKALKKEMKKEREYLEEEAFDATVDRLAEEYFKEYELKQEEELKNKAEQEEEELRKKANQREKKDKSDGSKKPVKKAQSVDLKKSPAMKSKKLKKKEEDDFLAKIQNKNKKEKENKEKEKRDIEIKSLKSELIKPMGQAINQTDIALFGQFLGDETWFKALFEICSKKEDLASNLFYNALFVFSKTNGQGLAKFISILVSNEQVIEKVIEVSSKNEDLAFHLLYNALFVFAKTKEQGLAKFISKLVSNGQIIEKVIEICSKEKAEAFDLLYNALYVFAKTNEQGLANVQGLAKFISILVSNEQVIEKVLEVYRVDGETAFNCDLFNLVQINIKKTDGTLKDNLYKLSISIKYQSKTLIQDK